MNRVSTTAPTTTLPRTETTSPAGYCGHSGFPLVRTTAVWGEFYAVASWSDQADSETVLDAHHLDDAKTEAAKARNTLTTMLRTFRGLRLRYRVVVREDIQVHPDYSEEYGERLAAGCYDEHFTAERGPRAWR